MRRRTIALIVGTAVAFGVLSSAVTPVNTDLGWMLAYGRAVEAGSPLLRTNVESFTEPEATVVRHDWLSCILWYQVHRHAGGRGLVLLKWLLVAIAILSLAWVALAARPSPMVLLIGLLLATHASWAGYVLLRAQLFSIICTGILVALGLSNRRHLFWWTIPLCALWANVHGGWIAGVSILWALALAPFFGRFTAWPSPFALRERVAAATLATLATLATPFGLAGWRVALTHLNSPARLLDREWLPLWRFSELVPREVWGLVGLLVSGVILALFLRRRDPRLWILAGGAILASFTASRHLRLAPILLIPAILQAVQDRFSTLPTTTQARFDRLASRASGLLLAGTLILFALNAGSATRLIAPGMPSPANALAVMQLNDIHGKVWNDFDWGGMLIWAEPRSTVAADGRHLSAYSNALLQTVVNFGVDGRDPGPILERYGAELVLQTPSLPGLDRLPPAFRPIYCDREACLFSRRIEDHAKARAGLLLPLRRWGIEDLFADPEGAFWKLALKSPRPQSGPVAP